MSLLTESHPARNSPTFSGRKNDSCPTQLLFSVHRLLSNVSFQMLPSAGPSFSSIELQTLVDANEVEEPLCWELWKWRDTNENRWFLRSMTTRSTFLLDTRPREALAFPMSSSNLVWWRGYADAWEESSFSTAITLLVPLRRWRYPWPVTCSNVQQCFNVQSISFSLFHTHFGRENRGVGCPLQAGDSFLSDTVNPAGTGSRNVCFDWRWLCYGQNSSLLQTSLWWNPPPLCFRKQKLLR